MAGGNTSPTVADPDSMGRLDLEPIVKEAEERFKRCAEWEADARERYIEDIKFAEGDSDNGYQWPNAIKRNRDIDKRPCLTMNVIRQHNLQIINQSRQNKSAIKIRATGGKATRDSANLISALVRQIEYRSGAQDGAYKLMGTYQVKGGIGWCRLATDYINKDSFDQEILILPILDPLSVYIDPDCRQPDKSDARFGFVFDTVPKDQFKKAYPQFKDMVETQPLGVGVGNDDLVDKDEVLICEYFRKVDKPDKLISFIDPSTGLRKAVRKSRLPEEVWNVVEKEPLTKIRETIDEVVEWYLIVGQKKADETIWPGKYIPLICAIGEETQIEGIMDRKGHTRAMKDAQRMYNYNNSAQVEFVALQSKTPYIAAAKAIEEYELMWNTANMVNHSVLPYNAFDPDHPDRPLPPPQRQQLPTSAPGFQEGMQTAFNQMMMTSGQWQNQMGMMGNERTGEAIMQRKMQSDTSTYHFQDNYGAALRNCGRQIIDLIPKVYDTKRMLRLVSEDGEEMDVELDPGAQQALVEQQNANGEIVYRVLNPTIGEYDVEADVGAAYGTRRQETVEALTLILTQAPGLTQFIGDLLLRAMDFREAGEAAERLRRMIPPQALGKGPTPNEMALQQKLQASQIALSKALEQYGQARVKLLGKAEMRDIDVYDSKTKRIAALAKMIPTDPKVLGELIEELGDEEWGESLKPVLDANKKALEAEAAEMGTAKTRGNGSTGMAM